MLAGDIAFSEELLEGADDADENRLLEELLLFGATMAFGKLLQDGEIGNTDCTGAALVMKAGLEVGDGGELGKSIHNAEASGAIKRDVAGRRSLSMRVLTDRGGPFGDSGTIAGLGQNNPLLLY